LESVLAKAREEAQQKLIQLKLRGPGASK